MSAISLILRNREEFHKALEYLQDILKLEPNNGAAWGSLGMSPLPPCICTWKPLSLTMMR